tara:strand:- start:772 stop:903 length:132 start_codon:yes stop_codon:yes gene_type:complete
MGCITTVLMLACLFYLKELRTAGEWNVAIGNKKGHLSVALPTL